jgi:hypothetical protein
MRAIAVGVVLSLVISVTYCTRVDPDPCAAPSQLELQCFQAEADNGNNSILIAEACKGVDFDILSTGNVSL